MLGCVLPIKNIDLIYFPDDITNYIIELDKCIYSDRFNFNITNNELIVKRVDEKKGWDYNHRCVIKIFIKKNPISIYLLEESGFYPNNYIKYNNKVIFKSRHSQYHINGGW